MKKCLQPVQVEAEYETSNGEFPGVGDCSTKPQGAQVNKRLLRPFEVEAEYGLPTGELAKKRGAGGGYTLAREPVEITAGDVVRALEGPIEPQICTAEGDPVLNCVREQGCGTRLVWLKLQSTIANALDGMTLAELARQTQQQNVTVAP